HSRLVDCDASARHEIRVFIQLAEQEAAEQTTLQFEKAPVTQPVAEQGMSNFVFQPALERGDEAFAAVRGQVDTTSSAHEVARVYFPVVDDLDHHGIGQQRTKRF